MKSWTIYKHVSPNGKVYVGISTNIKRRWAASGYYYHLSNTIFSNALNKYGWDSFQHIIIQEGLTKEEACNMEKELIAYYKAKNMSYNITDGGEGYAGAHSEKHNRHKVESRIANSDVDYVVIDIDFNYIVCQTEREAAEYLGGTQRNISHVLQQPIGYTFKKHYFWKHKKGTPVDIDAIKHQIQDALVLRHKKMSSHAKSISAKMVASSKKERESLTDEERDKRYKKNHRGGWHHTEKTKRELSKNAKGRDMSAALAARKLLPYNSAHTKPVIQLMVTGELVREFSSVTQASVETGTNAKGIFNCLAGRSNTSGGYKWQYKN